MGFFDFLDKATKPSGGTQTEIKKYKYTIEYEIRTIGNPRENGKYKITYEASTNNHYQVQQEATKFVANKHRVSTLDVRNCRIDCF